MIPFVAAGVGGLLLALAFPPWGLNVAAWVAFVPLLWAVHGEASTERCAMYGAVFGLVFFVLDMKWIIATLTTHGHFPPVPAGLVFLLMVAFLSLYPAAFGYVLACFQKSGFDVAVVAPFVWIGLEYARAQLITGFPWDLLGYSQVQKPLLVQVADITGVYGISFLVMLVNAAFWEVTRCAVKRDKVRWRPFVAAMGALIMVVAYGHIRIDQFSSDATSGRECTVGVLQGNIPQDLKWERRMREHTFHSYETLGKQAIDAGAELLVWPETSAPVMFGSQDMDWRIPGLISAHLGVPMLVGAPSEKMVGKDVLYYNSAFLVDGKNVQARYDKIHLVPFGEYMPLSWLLPLGPGIAAREADYSAGTTMTVMRPRHCPPLSVLICYEAIFPELARLAVNDGAEMLLNITNDGWFGKSGAPFQHLAMASLRAVENRVWLIRAANTGISAAFDPVGRMVKQIPLERQGSFAVHVNVHKAAGTFYCQYGDMFAWGCILICVVLGLSALRGRGVRDNAPVAA